MLLCEINRMSVYPPGNPLGAEKDFKIMEERASGSINSLPIVMKSQVGGYLYGSPIGEEEFAVSNVSGSATSVGKIKTSGPAIRPASRRGGNRRSKRNNMRLKVEMVNTRRNRNRKNGGGIFGDSMMMTSSDKEDFLARVPALKNKTRGGKRRTMRQGKGSASSWAKAVTKYYKDQKKTRKALKFSDALKEAAKLKKSGKLMC
jgi:hypothetical protein